MNMNRRSAGHMKKILATLLVTLLTYGAGQEAVAAAAQNAPGPKQYDYDGVGAPDAAMVRRVATTLGLGKTVDVKTTSSKKLAGQDSVDRRERFHGHAWPFLCSGGDRLRRGHST